jgi:hypothetical protein
MTKEQINVASQEQKSHSREWIHRPQIWFGKTPGSNKIMNKSHSATNRRTTQPYSINYQQRHADTTKERPTIMNISSKNRITFWLFPVVLISVLQWFRVTILARRQLKSVPARNVDEQSSPTKYPLAIEKRHTYQATLQPNIPSLRIIVSDSRAGADFILENTNGGEKCQYPSAALGATVMPWLDEKTLTCTVAYWHQRLLKEQCALPELQEQKQLCNWAHRLSQDNDIVGAFLEAALNDTANNMTSCHCPNPGFKIHAGWLKDMTDKNKWLSYSRLRGAKMIRLKRSPLERYLSTTIRQTTHVWDTPDVETKQHQLETFHGNNINIDDMLWYLARANKKDTAADAFVEEYASEILYLEYSDLRSRPEEAWNVIHEFWAVADGRIPDSHVSQWNDAASILQYVNNRDAVEEALGAYGIGHEIHKKYNPVQHIIMIGNGTAIRRDDSLLGVRTTVVRDDSEILDNLRVFDGETLVVISGPALNLNPHFRNHSDFYQKLVDFRSNLSDMTQDGSVVMLPTQGTQPRDITNPSSRRRSLRKISTTILQGNVALAGRAADLLALQEQWHSTFSKYLPQHGCQTLYTISTKESLEGGLKESKQEC